MISFKKLMGREEKFYDLLEASAEEARVSTDLLVKILGNDGTLGTTNIHDIIQTRRKDKRITREITEELCKTFVTPLEREDIEALSLGIPLSTTHAISTSIMGVGAVKRFGAVKWTVVERIIWAWVFTLPVCALIGYLTNRLCGSFGYR